MNTVTCRLWPLFNQLGHYDKLTTVLPLTIVPHTEWSGWISCASHFLATNGALHSSPAKPNYTISHNNYLIPTLLAGLINTNPNEHNDEKNYKMA